MGIVREDPIAVSGVNAQIELFDEKHADPPDESATENERHYHADVRELIGIAQYLANCLDAFDVAMSGRSMWYGHADSIGGPIPAPQVKKID